jgi:ATP/maltotriose-dependent transcriptional regulator MalT/DNA-binding SARP family transcriptional activator
MSHRSKFHPPGIDTDRHLIRSRLINSLTQSGARPPAKLLIEAQAGQGKSTLVAQYLDSLNADFAWYQLGTEDGDPVLFLTTLLESFQQSLPGFQSPRLEEMLAGGIIAAHDIAGPATVLLEDLEQHLQHDFYLVLDDIYLLEKFPHSLTLIALLLESSPTFLRLVLISRRPILPLVLPDNSSVPVMTITNRDLALNRQEIGQLFNNVLKFPLPLATVNSLHHASEGWIMGLTLAADRARTKDSVAKRLAAINSITRLGANDYFASEILDRFPRDVLRTLLKLALLDEIPVALARDFAEVDDVGQLLLSLERQNFFVRSLNDEKSVFTFHHLFRECLNNLQEKELVAAETARLLSQAGSWYQEHNQPEEALHYYVLGQDYLAAQRLLRQVGMTLHAHNRIVTLQMTLGRIASETIHHYPWLAYYQGIVAINTSPAEALPWFESARSAFVQADDELGELMALTQIIHFHAAVDGRHNLGYPLLERASRLYEVLSGQLEPVQRINTANIFLMTYSIFNTELDKADQYLAIGLKLTQATGLENLEAEARMARCYRHIFAGDFLAGGQEVEDSSILLQSTRVTPINKGALNLAYLNMLENTGAFGAYNHHKSKLCSALGPEIVDTSVFGAFIRLWDIDMHLATGDISRLRETLGAALKAGHAGSAPHLRCQYLQYQALLLATEGEAEKALEAVRESMALRAEIGGRYFEAINALFIGATYAKLGLHERAKEFFASALSLSLEMDEYFIRASLYAYRANLTSELGENDAAHEDMQALLTILRQRGYSHFYGWTPDLMKHLLGRAVRGGIEVDFARQLAAERLDIAILDDGSAIPRLKFHTLGRFEIEFNGQIVLRSHQLNPAPRQLLVLLLCAPNQQIHQEEVQSLIWPDASPAKSRANFDSLVYRLRKTMADVLAPIPVKNYLSLQREVLCLDNCWFDHQEYEEQARQGLNLARQKKFWQAANMLRSAQQLWQGEFMAGEPLPDFAVTIRRQLLLLHLESVLRRVELLSVDGQTSEAIQLITATLTHDPTNEALTRRLYDLHSSEGNHVETRKTLTDYEASLKAAGFLNEEVEGILASFWTASS